MPVQFDIATIVAGAFAILLSMLAYFLKAFMARMERIENRQSQNALNIEGIKKEIEDLHRERERIAERQDRTEERAESLPVLFANAIEPVIRRLERIEDRLMAGK